VEEGVGAVKIALRQGIVFVVVTLRTTDRHAEPRDARGVDPIDDVEIEIFRVN
jgi:hypothetical protein